MMEFGEDGELEITFIGNEGVVVAVGDQQVAIDALFGGGAAQYATTPPELIRQVETAGVPFHRIDLLLATHFHPDHFNPVSVGTYLTSNPDARFLSTGQSLDLLARKYPRFDEVADRVFVSEPAAGERDSHSFGEIRVDAFPLSHGTVNYGDVEHLGYLVYMGGKSLVHLGDGIIHERALRDAGVLDERIDAGFLPFWYLTYDFGHRLVERAFRPEHIFAVHIPPPQADALTQQVLAAGIGAVALKTPLETHRV